MSIRKRPTLRPGDVCRVSKKYRDKTNRNKTYVVLDIISGDGSSYRSEIRVAITAPMISGRLGKQRKAIVRRNRLWYTGYNIDSKPATPSLKFVDNRSTADYTNHILGISPSDFVGTREPIYSEGHHPCVKPADVDCGKCHKNADVGAPCWSCGYNN